MNRSIWPILGTLKGTTNQGESRPESKGNEGELHIPQFKDWGLTSRYFSVIPWTLTGKESYPSAKGQSVYSTAPADWAAKHILKK